MFAQRELRLIGTRRRASRQGGAVEVRFDFVQANALRRSRQTLRTAKGVHLAKRLGPHGPEPTRAAASASGSMCVSAMGSSATVVPRSAVCGRSLIMGRPLELPAIEPAL